MNALHLLLWVALPYIAITVFIAGHIWRYRTDQYGWTTRSTQLLESRKLKWGSILFHYGALAAIGGHVLGILVPASWTSAFGISEHSYHLLSAAAGTLAGMACVVGFVILAWRRITSTRVRVTTSRMDIAVYALLGLVIGLGIAETIGRTRSAAAMTTAPPSPSGSEASSSFTQIPKPWSASQSSTSFTRPPPGCSSSSGHSLASCTPGASHSNIWGDRSSSTAADGHPPNSVSWIAAVCSTVFCQDLQAQPQRPVRMKIVNGTCPPTSEWDAAHVYGRVDAGSADK